ncbi:aminodeoxychorismate lyase [Sediminicurvatus halobius]|uniref:Aminodeoxychorismate lyase n=1 Tax=Sediminicurvatus halobius TaxID=2182432 RepID=A0A2U2N2E8_9GAMM|nr:aminodeoxychorismate lyase [Spiribacter halobius]PWG63243.1 aminodeoxychorismate lyase [Spiribacter halobius]UEX76686.1 aminodeoxychorismate lyase [Spiribacter halobius]
MSTPAASVWLVDGEPAAAVPADDRGLAYGDGVFETIALVAGAPALWEAHIGRLQRGCERLGIPAPSRRQLDSDLARLAPSGDGVLRLTVTRGSGGRGYAPPAVPSPRRILARLPLPERPAAWWQEGVSVRVCHTRLASQPALAGIKHLNRLEQVLARQEWQDPAIAEGLMLAENGELIEATACNVLLRIGDRVLTPPTDHCGIGGLMRDHLLGRLVARGFAAATAPLRLETLAPDAELMLCNSLIGVWPVRWLDAAERPVSALAGELQAALRREGLVALPLEDEA